MFGVAQKVEIPLSIPKGSLAFWQERLERHDVMVGEPERRFGETTLTFQDPDGLRLALVETDERREFVPWADSGVPPEHQIRGVHSLRLLLADLALTASFLCNSLGFSPLGVEEGWHRYAVDQGESGQLVEIKVAPDGARGRGGTGATHHVAWRVRDTAEQIAVRDVVQGVGLRPSPQIDRFWF